MAGDWDEKYKKIKIWGKRGTVHQNDRKDKSSVPWPKPYYFKGLPPKQTRNIKIKIITAVGHIKDDLKNPPKKIFILDKIQTCQFVDWVMEIWNMQG